MVILLSVCDGGGASRDVCFIRSTFEAKATQLYMCGLFSVMTSVTRVAGTPRHSTVTRSTCHFEVKLICINYCLYFCPFMT